MNLRDIAALPPEQRAAKLWQACCALAGKGRDRKPPAESDVAATLRGHDPDTPEWGATVDELGHRTTALTERVLEALEPDPTTLDRRRDPATEKTLPVRVGGPGYIETVEDGKVVHTALREMRRTYMPSSSVCELWAVLEQASRLFLFLHADLVLGSIQNAIDGLIEGNPWPDRPDTPTTWLLTLEGLLLPDLLANNLPYESVLIPLLHYWHEHGSRVVKHNAGTRPLLPDSLVHIIHHPKLPPGLLASRTRAFHTASTQQAFLPGFGPDASEDLAQSLPLALWDLGSDNPTAPYAPIALRLWIEAVLGLPKRHWHEYAGFSVTQGELAQWLWPNPKRPRRPNEYHPAIEQALLQVDRMWLPYTDSAGLPMRMKPVAVLEIPQSQDANQLVRMAVRLPRDTSQGAPINRTILRTLGSSSGAAYRAYLNVAVQLFVPGKTRVPGPRKDVWFWSKCVEHYPRLTLAQVQALAFPLEGGDSNPRRRRAKALEALAKLEAAGIVHTHREGRLVRILPGPEHTGRNLEFS